MYQLDVYGTLVAGYTCPITGTQTRKNCTIPRKVYYLLEPVAGWSSGRDCIIGAQTGMDWK